MDSCKENSLLTVGMATYDDYDGAYFTIQALRLSGELPEGSEILIIDNAPQASGGLRALAGWIPELRVIHAPEDGGTSQPRNRVFAEAKGDVVICIDSHVLLAPGAIGAVLSSPLLDRGDLIQGPMLYDSLREAATHFRDEWRGEMWGTWGQAYWDRGVAVEVNRSGDTALFDPVMCEGRNRSCDWDRREEFMRLHGIVPAWKQAEPFEIPAMGLGMFACRRDAWLGFNPNFRGFGGEEWYIHEKYRKAGKRCWCVPGAKWLHRFRPAGVGTGYSLRREDKIRNYRLGLAELGISDDRAKSHFGDAWEGKMGCGCGKKQAAEPVAGKTEMDFYRQAVEREPGLALIHGAAAGSVVEFAARRGPTTLAIAAAKPGIFHTHAGDTAPAVDGKSTTVDGAITHIGATTHDKADVSPCSLLSLTLPAGETLAALRRHAESASKVTVFGARDDVMAFLAADRSWAVRAELGSVIELTRGLKRVPPLWRRAATYAVALWRRLREGKQGFGDVKGRRLELRLATCEACPSRSGETCGECGCPVAKKASWATEKCPLGKWD